MRKEDETSARYFMTETIFKELEKGNRCITLKKLFKNIPRDKKPVTRLEERMYTKRARDCMEEIHGIPICNVTQAMFDTQCNILGGITRSNYIDQPPETTEEAIECIPFLCGKPIVAVWVPPNNRPCLIYQMNIEGLTNNFAKYTGHIRTKIERVIERGILPEESIQKYKNSLKIYLDPSLQEFMQEMKDDMKDMKTDLGAKLNDMKNMKTDLETKLNEILKKLSDQN